MDKIPVIVVIAPSVILEPSEFLEVMANVSPLDVISRQGQISPATEIAIMEVRGVETRELVECGILLRNAGRTVVVCDTRRVPLDLVTTLHNFMIDAKGEGKAVRTELLFIEEAIEAVTDLPDVDKLP